MHTKVNSAGMTHLPPTLLYLLRLRLHLSYLVLKGLPVPENPSHLKSKTYNQRTVILYILYILYSTTLQ